MKAIIPSIVVACSLVSVGNVAASVRHEVDESIEHNLRAALNERHVHFHVHHGVVTLDGHVRSEQDRQAIESIVRGTPGVAAVKDELKVAMPEPGAVVAPSSIPVYAAEPPAPATPIVTSPAPVVVPDYPRLKILASTSDDVPLANRIAAQMRADALPASGLQDVKLTIRNGIVWLKGAVDSRADHDALIASLQHAGGMSAIYDQLEVR